VRTDIKRIPILRQCGRIPIRKTTTEHRGLCRVEAPGAFLMFQNIMITANWQKEPHSLLSDSSEASPMLR
jgi:hypothetical protein